MGLTSYLDNLREKPVHHRRRFAFWSSLSFTAVLFVFWLGSFTGATGAAAGQVAEAVSNAGSPGASLVAGVADFGGDIWSMITGPKKVKYSVIEILPGKK